MSIPWHRQYLLPLSILSLSVILIGGFLAKIQMDKKRTYSLVLATGSQQGIYYPFGKAIAQVISQVNPQLKIEILETEGGEQNMKFLEANKAQLAIIQTDTETTPSGREIASLFTEVFHLIAAENSGIKTLSDLRGKRIALMPSGSGSYNSFWFVMDHYGLNQRDFQYTSVPWSKASELFKNGEVDAIFRVLPVGNKFIRDLLKITPSELVPIDQVGAMKIKFPYWEENPIPKGVYKADPPVPSNNLPTVGVQAILVVRANIPAEIVGEITRILFQYRRNIVNMNSLGASIQQPTLRSSILPLHEGAQAYYDREKPNFLVSNADLFGLILSTMTLVISGIWQIKARWSQTQKNRADYYNLEIIDLIEQVKIAENLTRVEELEERLFIIFKETISDLDEDRIDPGSFQSFTFAWDTALEKIKEQKNHLKN